MRLQQHSPVQRIGLFFILAGIAAAIGAVGCESPTHVAAATRAQQPAATKAPSASAAPELPIDARPLIACFGDSLTAGLGMDTGQSYPDDLQRRLDTQGYHYRVVNLGISGDTTKDGLERLAHVVERKPAIVVLEFGGNDGLRGLPVDATRRNLASMIHALQGSGAKVALAGITLPPQYGPEYITHFDAMYPALAKRFRVSLLPFLLVHVYGTPGDMQSDGIHATAQGNEQVAANVEKLIRPLLKR